ncbi:hypothetical protein LJC63_09865 [Ruminococcaceae bacterium OttesenSCG-928-L11]|nr:hypothetical protein [Ruminococcaceae bacterium OttesenSCG-928-L11]
MSATIPSRSRCSGGDENLSTPTSGAAIVPKRELQLKASASHGWTVNNQLSTDANISSVNNPAGLYGQNVLYQIWQDGTVYKLDKSLNYTFTLKNEKSGLTEGVLMTDKLEFSSSFTLPAGITLTNGATEFPLDTLSDADLAPYFELKTKTGMATADYDLTYSVTRSGSTYTVAGTVTNKSIANGAAKDLDTLILRLNFLNVAIESNDIKAANGWTEYDTNSFSASYAHTLDLDYYPHENTTATDAGQSTATAWFYTGAVAPTGTGTPGVNNIGITKAVDDSSTIYYPTHPSDPTILWEKVRYKNFTLSGFGNIERNGVKPYNRLDSFTVTDTFDSAKMLAYAILPGKYTGVDSTGTFTIYLYSNTVEKASKTFTYGTLASATDDASIWDISAYLTDKIDKIVFDYGTVGPGFNPTTNPKIGFITQTPSANATLTNYVKLDAKTDTGKSIAADDSASYNVVVNGTPTLQGAKFSSGTVGTTSSASKTEFYPSDEVYYHITVSNTSGLPIKVSNIVDVLPYSGGQYFEGYEFIGYGVTDYTTPNLDIIKATSFSNDPASVTNSLSSSDFTSGQITSTTTFNPLVLESGKKLVIRYKMKLIAGAKPIDQLTNTYTVNFAWDPGVGVGSGGSDSINGRCDIKVKGRTPQAGVFKMANKLPGGRTSSDFAGTDNYYNIILGTLPATTDLPSEAQNRYYGRAPEYEAGDKVTFTIIARNTGKTTLSNYKLVDVLKVMKDSGGATPTGALADLSSYFVMDSNGNLAIEGDIVNIAVYDKNKARTYNSTCTVGTGAAVYADNGFNATWHNGQLITTYGAGTGPTNSTYSLKTDEQIQISYTLTLKDTYDVTDLPVMLYNYVDLYDIKDTSADTANKISVSSSGSRRGRMANSDMSVQNYAPIVLKGTVTGSIGLEKKAIYSAPINADWKDLRVRNTAEIQADLDGETVDAAIRNATANTAWLRGSKATGNTGAVFLYEITIHNDTGKNIAAGTLKLYDQLPPFQKIADGSNVVAVDSGKARIFDSSMNPKGNVITLKDGDASTNNRQTISFTNPEIIPAGESKSIYIRTVIPDYTAASGWFNNNSNYPDGATVDQYETFNSVLLVNSMGWTVKDNLGYETSWQTLKDSPNPNKFKSLHTDKLEENDYIMAQVNVLYHDDQIAPQIVKKSNKSVSTLGQPITFTVEVSNTSSKPMTNYKIVDFMDARFNLDAAVPFSYYEKATPDATTRTAITTLSGISSVAKAGTSDAYHTMEWDLSGGEYPLASGKTLVIEYQVLGFMDKTPINIYKNHALLLPDTDFVNWNKGSYVTQAILDKGDNGEGVLKGAEYANLRQNMAPYLTSGNAGLWADVNVTLSQASGLATRKGIKLPEDTKYTYNMGVAETANIYQEPGGLVNYRLEIENVHDKGKSFNDISVLDVLPHVGDVGVLVKDQHRESRFPVTFPDASQLGLVLYKVDKAGNSTPITDYTVGFAAGVDSKDAKVSTNPSDAADPWNMTTAATTGDTTGKNAILLHFGATVVLAAEETLYIEFNGQLPTPEIVTRRDPAGSPSSWLELKDIAWNSFAVQVTPDGEGLVRTEPIRVGVKTMTGSVEIQKQVQDDAADFTTESFAFKITDRTTGKTAQASTDSTGKVYFGNLIIGNEYVLEEILADDTYVFNKWVSQTNIPTGITVEGDKLVFTATAADTYTVEAHNDLHKGSITVNKTFTNTDFSKFPNLTFTFAVYDKATNALVATQTAGNGRPAVFSDLAINRDYYLTEESKSTFELAYWTDADGSVTADRYEFRLRKGAADRDITVTAHNTRVGSVTVTKEVTGSTIAPSGFTFTLTGADGTVYGPETTDAGGVAVFDSLPLSSTPTSYTLREVSKTGYTFDRWILNGKESTDETLTLTLSDTAPEIRLVARNTRNPGTLVVQKSYTNSTVSTEGVHFTLTDSTGKVIEATTVQSGVALFENLAKDVTYTLRETANDAYAFRYWEHNGAQISTPEITFTLTDTDSSFEVVAWNERLVNALTIYKTDAETGALLDDATFWLTDNIGNRHRLTTVDGKATLNLPFTNFAGEYILTELHAPNGYRLETSEIRFTLSEAPVITVTAGKTIALVHDTELAIVFLNDKSGGDDGGDNPPETPRDPDKPTPPTPPGPDSPGRGPNDGDDPNRDDDFTTIGDDPTPLGNLPNLLTIFDDGIPLANLPWAGGANPLPWLGLGFLSIGLILKADWKKLRGKREESDADAE